jgi:hypothetical protein
MLGQLRLHRETFRDLGDGEEFEWILAVTRATDRLKSRLHIAVAAGDVLRRVMPALISAQTMACSTFSDVRGQTIAQTRSMT